MSKQKGARGERQLVEWFDERGWYSQRTGGSGAGTSDARPDVIAMRPNEYGRSDVVVVEHKSHPDGSARFSKKEIHKLDEVAERSGGIALVVTRPDLRLKEHDHLYAMKTEDLKENKKSYTITSSMLPTESLEEVIESAFGSK